MGGNCGASYQLSPDRGLRDGPARAVGREHLFPEAPRAASERRGGLTFQQATRQFQEQLLRNALRETEWNVTQAAEKLDVARSHVYSLIRSFGLERDKP